MLDVVNIILEPGTGFIENFYQMLAFKKVSPPIIE